MVDEEGMERDVAETSFERGRDMEIPARKVKEREKSTGKARAGEEGDGRKVRSKVTRDNNRVRDKQV